MRKQKEIIRIVKSVIAGFAVAAMTAVTVLPAAGSVVKAADEGMVLHWDMTKNTDNKLQDLTGNGHDGVLNGSLESSKVEGIDVLKMTGGYVDIPDGTISTDAAEVTVNMLVKIDQNIAASWMWCLGTSSQRYMYFTGCCSSGQGSVMRGGVGCVPDQDLVNGKGYNYESFINGSEALPVSEWQNVTITYKDGGQFIFYKNGVKQAETMLGEGKAGTFTLQDLMTAGDARDGYMGWSFYTGNDPKFQGTVADFRIYEQEMTADEVKTLSDNMSDMLNDLKDSDFTEADIHLTETDCLGSNEAKEKVTTDLVLPDKTTVGASGAEAAITKWTSDTPAVISDEGKVTRPLTDQTVTMTAEVTKNGISVNKNLVFTVLGSAESSSLAKADAEALEVRNSEDVSGNLTLPETGQYGSVITWESSDESVISTKAEGGIAAGKVNRPAVNTDVTLTATVKNGDSVEKKEIVCHVRRKAEIAETTDYLFAYFPYTGFKDERVYFGVSEDGLNFKALNNGQYVLESRQGTHGIRDPFVIRSHEGDKFYMIATDLTVAGLDQDGEHYPGMGWSQNQVKGSQSIVVWESDDLVNWSEERLCKVALDTAGCTWAPEAYWDDETEQYVVFWASKVAEDNYAKQRVYYATTRDFYTFSEAKVWIEEAGSVIDTTVIKVDDYYYRYTKNEAGNTNVYGTPSKRIYCERSKSLTSEDWELVSKNSLDFQGGQIEGGCIFKINTDDAENAKDSASRKGFTLTGEDVYCLTADRTGATIFPGVSDDITKGNFNILGTSSSVEVDGKQLYSMPDPVASHGTIMPVTSEEYDRLMKKYDSAYADQAKELSEKADQLIEEIKPVSDEAPTDVTKDLVLPTDFGEGVTVTWESSDEDVISNTGVVTRPGAAQGDKVVELTVTITVSGTADVRDQVRTGTFQVTVKADGKLPYVDVTEKDWWYDAVVYNYYAGTMTGKDKTHFAPVEDLKRAQFTAVLYKMNESPDVEFEEVFPDVPANAWCADCVTWALDNEIVTGYTDTNTFKPDNEVTRAELATMLYRYAKNYKKYDVSAEGDYSTFPDADEVQEFAKDAMSWAVGEGIITGKTIDEQLMLVPNGKASRAECATIIERFMKEYAQ